jgi:hypothetical protein
MRWVSFAPESPSLDFAEPLSDQDSETHPPKKEKRGRLTELD